MSKFKIGRSAVNGQFTTVAEARRKPTTHVVETIKVPPHSKPTKPKK